MIDPSRYMQAESPIRSVPSQEEIDRLGGNTDRAGRECRFELVYQRAKGEQVTMLIGVMRTVLHRGRWLRQTYHLLPRYVWPEMALLIGTSMVGIQTTHAPAPHGPYNPEEILEMYGVTRASPPNSSINAPMCPPIAFTAGRGSAHPRRTRPPTSAARPRAMRISGQNWVKPKMPPNPTAMRIRAVVSRPPTGR